jgi:hypothetical protein
MAFILWLALGLAAAATASVTIVRHRRLHGRRLYQESLERALADGILTDDEARELKSVREQRDLTEAEVRMVALSLYRRALRDAVADSRITAEETEELAALRSHLGLSDRDLRGDVSQLRRICVLSEIEHEHLPQIESPVALANGESCHWVVQGRLADRLAAPGRKTELRSVNFDVAGNVPFSAEGDRSHLTSSDEMLPTDLGVVVVTNRRTLFRGARRTVVVPHMKLSKLQLYKDGIGIEQTDPPLRSFLIVDDPELTAAVLLCASRIRRRELSGLTTRTA